MTDRDATDFRFWVAVVLAAVAVAAVATIFVGLTFVAYGAETCPSLAWGACKRMEVFHAADYELNAYPCIQAQGSKLGMVISSCADVAASCATPGNLRPGMELLCAAHGGLVPSGSGHSSGGKYAGYSRPLSSYGADRCVDGLHVWLLCPGASGLPDVPGTCVPSPDTHCPGEGE